MGDPDAKLRVSLKRKRNMIQKHLRENDQYNIKVVPNKKKLLLEDRKRKNSKLTTRNVDEYYED